MTASELIDEIDELAREACGLGGSFALLKLPQQIRLLIAQHRGRETEVLGEIKREAQTELRRIDAQITKLEHQRRLTESAYSDLGAAEIEVEVPSGGGAA